MCVLPLRARPDYRSGSPVGIVAKCGLACRLPVDGRPDPGARIRLPAFTQPRPAIVLLPGRRWLVVRLAVNLCADAWRLRPPRRSHEIEKSFGIVLCALARRVAVGCPGDEPC